MFGQPICGISFQDVSTKPWSHGICHWPPSARANVAVGPRSLQPRQVARCVAHATPSAVLCSRDGAPLETKMEGVTLNDLEVNIKQTWWEHSQHTCFAKACDGGDGCVFNMHILCLWLGCASKPQGTTHLQSISAQITPSHPTSFLRSPQDSLGERLPSRIAGGHSALAKERRYVCCNFFLKLVANQSWQMVLLGIAGRLCAEHWSCKVLRCSVPIPSNKPFGKVKTSKDMCCVRLC